MGDKQLKRLKQKQNKVIVKEPQSTISNVIVWKFDEIDINGDFAFDVNRDDFNENEVFSKILSYSKMTWGQIKEHKHDNGKPKHHFLTDLTKLSEQAEERIKAKQFMDRTEYLYSLALTNTMRLIGFRNNDIFSVVWYDPHHKFCPSHKRHT